MSRTGVRIGATDLLEDLPRSVRIRDRPYILSRDDSDRLVVFEATCPHQGGTVDVESEDCLRCPQHGWEFDSTSGESTNVPGESLHAYPVEKRADGLFADIPDIDPTVEFSVDDHDGGEPTVSLLSHATLSIEYDGFTLVTDPWLDGPAFLGGWTQYPPPTRDVESVAEDADAVWITHEHSDHLNRRTLSQFPSDTPVYVPELNYRRLSERLEGLGFETVRALPTERPYRIAEGIEAVCFESDSTWNDSILAVNCGGFRILNFNDAGVNWRVREAIPSADLVATGFAFGATGYPITWHHLDRGEKREIVAERNEGQLRKCEQFVRMFDPEYLLPFAKFFTLVQPQHQHHRAQIEKNTPMDVRDRLAEYDVEVLDLLPGEAWNGGDGSLERRPDREQYFDEEFERAYVAEAYESLEPIVDEPFELTHDELEAYFADFSGSNLAAAVGDHALSLTCRGDERTLHGFVRFDGGDVTCRRTDEPLAFADVDAAHHVRMTCPGRLVQHVIRHDLSWDEIHIGYWCEFERQPDEYNLWFWHLLHAPWEAREDAVRLPADYDIQTDLTGVSMADLVENHDIGDVLAEYGLYCAGCHSAVGEDVLEAARIHGLDHDQARDLVETLESSVTAH